MQVLRFVTTSRDVSVVLLRQDSGREFQKQFFQAENPNFQWGSISTMCFPQDNFRMISAQFVEVAEVAFIGCEPTLVSTGISSSFDDAVGNVVVLSRLSTRNFLLP